MVITFEVIRDIHRKEKESSKLQKLPDNFFQDVAEYIREKSKKKSDPIEFIELENIKMIVNDIIDRREHKVLAAAMAFVRSGMVMENMLPQERELFDRIVEILREYRRGFWESVGERKDEEPEEDEKSEDVYEVIEERAEAMEEVEEREPDFGEVYLPLKDLPVFIWSDGRQYRIKKGTAVKLPKRLAEFLASKGVLKRLKA